MERTGNSIKIVDILRSDELLDQGQEIAFTTELHVLIRDQKLTLIAVPQSGDTSHVWLDTIELEMPLMDGLKKIFFEKPILSLPYKATHIYLDQWRYTLVPNDLDKSGTPELWTALHTPIDEQYVLSQQIASEQLRLHYTVPLELYNFCQRSFSLPTYDHTLQPLIALATRLSRKSEPKLVMMRIGKAVVDVLYVADGVLELVNRYQVRNEVDILYFVTALWRQFFLSSESVPLFLYNSDSSFITDTFLDQLNEYISRVELNYYPGLLCPEEVIKRYEAELPPEFILQLLCE
ncbi:DUF3822 family protein [Porphyromonadaceae bacterium W3.11]|nr:DUF3822 family protein [Porphyromonadaceae bacterium W3.11]